MREITLDSLTDEQLDDKSRLLIDMLRTKYPKLDLRRGTVLRDLLVDTDAAIAAWLSAQAEEQRASSSLLELSRRADSGEKVDASDVDAILSNFNMKAKEGTKAKGYVRISVSRGSDHTVLEGTRFLTSDDRAFVSTEDVSASTTSSGQALQRKSASGWWYLVPVEAEEPGSDGNLTKGTALEPNTALADFVSASVYSAFSGGSDVESLDGTVSRIRPSLSVRALTSPGAIEAQLRDAFDETESPVVAVSVCGFGDPAQHRDQHNLFGVSVGGRVDVYVRNFTDLPLYRTAPMTGRRVSEVDGGAASYEISVSHAGVPGIISVHSVLDAGADGLSSYAFDTQFSADVSGTWHDFKVSAADAHETANTVWRDAKIVVSGVPALAPDGATIDEKSFQVGIVALPKANELQALVDDPVVRNAGTDTVVRGPMVVNVSVNAIARCPASRPMDVDAAKVAVRDYINGTGFVGRLTRSEISSILRDFGATSVDLRDENAMLYGYVRDAFGRLKELSGDALDLDSLHDPRSLLTRNTAVFVAEPENIRITALPTG